MIAIVISIVARLESELTRAGQLDPIMVAYIQSIIETLIRDLMIGFFAFTVIGICLATLYSHRIFGAAFAINQHLDRLLQGDYEKSLTLRAHDQLQETADKLNELTKKLRS